MSCGCFLCCFTHMYAYIIFIYIYSMIINYSSVLYSFVDSHLVHQWASETPVMISWKSSHRNSWPMTGSWWGEAVINDPDLWVDMVKVGTVGTVGTWESLWRSLRWLVREISNEHFYARESMGKPWENGDLMWFIRKDPAFFMVTLW